MSSYYKISGLKVRVSDHEPNTSLNGSNDVYFYTKSADNRKLSVVDQVYAYCEKNDLDESIFNKVIEDYPDEEITKITFEKVQVSMDFIEKYRGISGKKSTHKKENFCLSVGYTYKEAFSISQGMYIVK